MYFHRELRTYKGRQVLQGGLGNLRDGTVVEEQTLLGLLANALDLAQGALDGGLGAEIAVEGDAETVRFVADPRQDLQGLGVAVDELTSSRRFAKPTTVSFSVRPSSAKA